jgi:hypothetical protein
MKRIAALVAVVVAVAAACVSSGPAPEAGTRTGTSGSIDRMREYLDNGMAKVADGAVAEGARQLVAVLAERQKPGVVGADADEIAGLAETELGKIGAALSLEAGPEWLDEANNQRTASTLDVGTPKALQPSVILTYNMGRGRSLVAGAPIAFAFERGGGSLTAAVNTNELGQATCSLGRLDDVASEQVVRAAVEYRVEGLAYRFEGVMKDFAYAPPGNRAIIVALERTPTAIVQPPAVLDAVFNALRGVNLDFSHFDGALAPREFEKLFAGDRSAIAALGLGEDVAYLVTVLNECPRTSQIVLQGKAMNLWKAPTSATVRLIRALDGKILFSGTAEGAGQGGTAEKAAFDGLSAAASAIAQLISDRLPEIEAALAEGR